MTTIPLTEALERATKGPMRPTKISPSEFLIKAESGESAGKFYRAEDCALLAHCRNELPGLVEAANGVTDFLEQRSCYWSAKDMKVAIKKLRAAIHSAQNVKIQ